MKKFITLLAVAALLFTLAPAAQAAVILSDSHTGDYRILYETMGRENQNGSLAGVGGVNAFVTADANSAASTKTKDLGITTWYAVASFIGEADAKTNTLTTGTGTGIHIYTPTTTLGTYQLVAIGYTELWNASSVDILTPIRMGDGAAAGSDGGFTAKIWTGSKTDGTAQGDGTFDTQDPQALGSAFGTTSNMAFTQNYTATNGEWIFSATVNDQGGDRGEFHYYGISSVIPEPATMSLLAIGGIALIRRRRRA